MKTIRNKKTNELLRVDNKTADNMVGNTWEFVPKSEWKKTREVPTEKQKVQDTKKEIAKSKKQQSREKLKEKQRSL
jgi:hypothetical protein